MDEQSEASQTAMLTAGYRARASARPDPICRDPWAAALAGPRGAELAHAHDAAMPHGELWLAVRTAWIDQRVRRLTGPERPQVVMLGAGLDTRAARLARPGVRFFEVDHPATQAHKRAAVGALPGYPVDAATWVPCDFERDDFTERLVAAGFDAAQPALVVWEGVTMYLSVAAIRATLERVASLHPRSVLVFDKVGKALASGTSSRAGDRELAALVEDVGEPFAWGADDVLPMMATTGFRHVRVVRFDEACLSLTGSYDRERYFRFQTFVVASVEAEVGL